MRNKIIPAVILLSLAIILLSSCKSKRAVVKAPLKEYGVEYLLEKMGESQFDFNTVSMKVSIAANLKKKETFNLTGTLRIIRDSVIWISLSPGLGIEAARLYITQDSVQFMDRINNRYFSSPLDFFNINYQVDMDFNMLQGILLGNDFSCYEYSKFKAGYDGNNYRLTAQERRKQKKYVRNNGDARRVLIQNIWLNPETFKIEGIHIKAVQNQNRKLQATYSDFTNIEGQLIPAQKTIELNMQEAGKSNFKPSISLNFSKIEINKEMKIPFNIPDKYMPMSL